MNSNTINAQRNDYSRSVSFPVVKQAAAGGWAAILPALGIPPEFLSGKHGPCPGCGGKDRFRFDDQKGDGTFFCSQGGGEPLSGDGFELLRHAFGWSSVEALQEVAQHLGVQPQARVIPIRAAPRIIDKPPTPSATQDYARAIWSRVDQADAIVSAHPYAIAKGVDWAAGAGRATASGLLVGPEADCLVIPVRKQGTGDVVAVECINPDGKKQTFGPKGDGYLLLGNDVDPRAQWHMVEGWADAVAILRHIRNSVVIVAFGLGGFGRVERMIEADHNPEVLEMWRDAS